MIKFLKFKKSYAVFMFLFFLFLPLSLSFGKEKINIGYFALEPHNIKMGNTHSGALYELWENVIAPKMGVELNWSGPLPPLRLLDNLKKGELNVVALMAKNEERVKAFDYPDQSFFTMVAGVALKKDNKLNKINTIDNLFNLTLGFFQKGFIPPALRDNRIKWYLVPATDWQKANFNKLLSKRIDAAFNPESLSLQYEAKRMKITNEIKILEIPNTSSELYSLFSKKDNGKYLKKYNRVISDKAIKEKYLGLLKKYI